LLSSNTNASTSNGNAPELELAHLGKEEIIKEDPFLAALAEREEANRDGKLMVSLQLDYLEELISRASSLSAR
jgi:hypothetical protein